MEEIIEKLKKFRDERNWEQFHNNKDLAIALNVETSELLELFLWKNTKEVDKEELKEELADILSYALLIADKNKLDIFDKLHTEAAALTLLIVVSHQ